MPAAQAVQHGVVKLRRLPLPAGPAAESGLDGGELRRAWLDLRPLPPGRQPCFSGSIWYHSDGDAEAKSPALHLLPKSAPGRPRYFYLNLFFDPFTGGAAVLDPAPGWRRMDFMFNLPPGTGALGVRIMLQGGGAAPLDAGTLRVEHGVWVFAPAQGAPPFPPPEPGALRKAFVGGAPKSGTTWVQLLLNEHPEVTASGEGEWLQAVAPRPWRASIRWFPPGIAAAALHDWSNAAVLEAAFELRRVQTGCAVVVDKSPGNAACYRALLAFAPGARLIHCLRHPLDVVISRLHHEARIYAGTGRPSVGLEPLEEAIAALPPVLAGPAPMLLPEPVWPLVQPVLEEYASFQAEALATAAEHPGVLLIVRYEDLLADGVGGAAAIFRHLDVAAGPELVAACVAATSFDNLRARRNFRPFGFYRAGTARQFERGLAEESRTRAMALLRQALPDWDRLGYSG